MTNAEKYLNKGTNIHEMACKMIKFFENETNALNVYIDDIETFFWRRTKPLLTENERVILRNISKRYNKIGRKFSGALYLHEAESVMIDSTFEDFFEDSLFQFIKERRRI